MLSEATVGLRSRSGSTGGSSRPHGRSWIWIAAVVVALGVSQVVRAETWICPDCLEEVQRESGSPSLDCPACDASYATEDLSWIIGYGNYRTRDVDLNFLLMPSDCDRFREDGLQAMRKTGGTIWVPWIAVRYYIPRQRILVLTDGAELTTDYAKTRGAPCPEPPGFVFDLVDTVLVDGQSPRTVTRPIETDLAELFFVAATPEARDAARARFIKEVESGLHPRLPRTDPRVAGIPRQPVIPKGAKDAVAEVEVRVSDAAPQILRVHVVRSSGNEAVDRALAQAAQATAFMPAGEMGVPVPATLVLRYSIRDGAATVESRPAVPSIWEE
jgi:TonB family protein